MGSFSLCAQLQPHSENSRIVIGKKISQVSLQCDRVKLYQRRICGYTAEGHGMHCALSALKKPIGDTPIVQMHSFADLTFPLQPHAHISTH